MEVILLYDPSPVCHSLRSGMLRDPPKGRSQFVLKQIIDLENHHPHQPISPLPTLSPCGIWEGRGIGPFADFDKAVHDLIPSIR